MILNLTKQKCGAIIRTTALIAFWMWIIIYPILVNVFHVHILGAFPFVDVAIFVGFPAVVIPFYLYLITIFKTKQHSSLVSVGKIRLFTRRIVPIIVTIIILSSIATTDYIRVKELKNPLFSIPLFMFLDGGTVIYFGTGYILYSYHGIAGKKIVHRGPKIDILYMPFLSVDGSFFVNE
jgi:hypothetical protein